MTSTVHFRSFDRMCSGRVVTSAFGLAVVNARNPYGSHNLVLVDQELGQAIRHGTDTVVACAFAWMPEKTYRKVRRFLADRNVGCEWVVSR